MPESLKKPLKKAVEDLYRPIGDAGTKISNEIKLIADKAPVPDMGEGITRNRNGVDNPKIEPPVIEPPTRMSTSGDKEAAKKRSIAEQRRRKGRASTILTDDPLGG